MGIKSKANHFVNLTSKKLATHSSDAVDFAQKAVSLTSQTKNWRLQVQALNYLGEAHLQNRDTIPAILSIDQAHNILSDQKDTLGVAVAQLKLGQLYFSNGDSKLGEKAAHDALLGYRLIHDTLGMASSYRLLAHIAYQLDDVKTANENLTVAYTLMATKAISEKNKIQHLQVQQFQDKRIRWLLFVLIGIAGFLAAMLSILYKKKQEDNQKLAWQVAENQHQKRKLRNRIKTKIKNISLELLNKQLVNEMAERERTQVFSSSKGKYLAAITNEMRSPLNDIAGLTQLLLDNHPRADQVDQIRVMQFCTNELTSLTNEALGYSNFEDIKFGDDNEAFHLVDLTHQVFDRISFKAEKKGLHFHYTVDKLIPPYLIGSGPRLSNVLTNLLVNCIDTTTVGLVNISVLLADKTEREAIVKFVIEAPDKGMLGNFYHHKNLPFKTESEKLQAVEDKLLSLAMTKRMVEVQNGKMQVENLLEEATRFTLLMPFAGASGYHGIHPSDEGKYDSLDGINVLLVEDNKINQVVVVKMLRKYGAQVSTAENGFEALDSAGSARYSILS